MVGPEGVEMTSTVQSEWVVYSWDESIGKRVEVSRVTASDIKDVPVQDGHGVILASIHDTGRDTFRPSGTIIIHTADGKAHAFDSDREARMYTRRIKGGQCMHEPRRAGGRYQSPMGEYTVLDVTMATHRRDAMASITVRWETGQFAGRVVTHGTAWAPREDRELVA